MGDNVCFIGIGIGILGGWIIYGEKVFVERAVVVGVGRVGGRCYFYEGLRLLGFWDIYGGSGVWVGGLFENFWLRYFIGVVSFRLGLRVLSGRFGVM